LLSDVTNKNLVFEDYEKSLCFIDSLKMLGGAWDSVTIPQIQQAYSSILSVDDYKDIQEGEVPPFSELIETIPECILYNYTMDRLNNWLFCDDVECPKESETLYFESSTSEMNGTNYYKDIPNTGQYVILEEIINGGEEHVVPTKSEDLSESITDILTTTQEEFITTELGKIDENDFYDPNNVSSDDAVRAIDILLKFVKSDPKIEPNNADFLIALKDKICNRPVDN
jgi:hypothetical protein